jgi:excinuclease UvrABC nuclease subunit
MPQLAPLPRGYAAVRARLGELPACPGVYLFRDRSRRLLYVGKSVSLRQRVRSYFGEHAGRFPKLRRLRSRAAAIEWTETGSELEALLLESRLVKEHHPPFNRLLHRHRHLVFLRLDLSDPFPRLEVTEHLCRDGARYFGPFTLTADAERLADILSDTLRLRTCDPPGSRVHRIAPCLRRDLGLCHGPCVRPTDRAAYRDAVQSAILSFDRDGLPFREQLREEMADAAERLLFERAARLRDALASLDGIAGRQQAVISAVDALDVVAACPSRHAEHLELFLFSQGRFVDQHTIHRGILREPGSALEASRDLLRCRGGIRRASSPVAPSTRPSSPTPQTGSEVEPELLDQIFIISRWLRQHSGEGRHFLLPADEEANYLALRLGAWLRDVVLEVSEAPTAGTDTVDAEPGEE